MPKTDLSVSTGPQKLRNLMTGVSRQDLISVRLNDCCSILPLTGELGIGWTALHHTAVL
ncbi:hypothetical protein [Paenibacillus sp. FSL K6-2862]|uniref:hypothetical protein n=1 Tax=Paenibacillus sp. FSL K6-2862 TaxID=2921484 RepID=UPI0030F72F49